MGKKNKKKGAGAEKTQAKTEKKFQNKLKKELAAKGEEDIDTLLARFAAQDRAASKVTERSSGPPSPRSSFTLTPHPLKDQLILYGGEYFNGSKTETYGDLYLYNVKQNKWSCLTCPGGPPPRSGHQAQAVAQAGGQLWVFGGEFTSQSQSQFHHYRDLWVFHLTNNKWEQVKVSGGPSSRSGHRMVVVGRQLLVFGGFHDNGRNYKYYNDVYTFSLDDRKWAKLDVAGTAPSPRSASQVAALSDGRVLVYGGYSREKMRGQEDEDEGVTHADMFMLTPDKHREGKYRWVGVKGGGHRPSPRCGLGIATLPAPVDRAVLFGGVFDQHQDQDQDDLRGLFFNDLFLLDLAKHSWQQVTLMDKKESAKTRRKKKEGEKEEQEEEELLEEAVETMTVDDSQPSQHTTVSDDGVFKVTVGASLGEQATPAAAAAAAPTTVFTPHPRINPGMAVKKSILYLYGGVYEEDQRTFTLADFYCLDLNKLDQWHTIIALNMAQLEWVESESDDDEDDGSSEDEEDEEDGSSEDEEDKEDEEEMETD